MLTHLAFVFISVQASSALVRTSAFLQPVVRGQVYSFEISPPLCSAYHNAWRVFSSPEHEVLMVSYCGQWLSVVRRRASCDVRRLSSVNI